MIFSNKNLILETFISCYEQALPISGKKKDNIQIFYIRWLNDKIPIFSICGVPVQYFYNNGGRIIITLNGKINLYTKYYSCTNNKYEFYNHFTLAQNIVLSYKHFGLGVWKWLIQNYLEFHSSYSSIARRLKVYYEPKLAQIRSNRSYRHFLLQALRRLIRNPSDLSRNQVRFTWHWMDEDQIMVILASGCLLTRLLIEFYTWNILNLQGGRSYLKHLKK